MAIGPARHMQYMVAGLCGEQPTRVQETAPGTGDCPVSVQVGDLQIRFADPQTLHELQQWWSHTTVQTITLPYDTGNLEPLGPTGDPSMAVTVTAQAVADASAYTAGTGERTVLRIGIGPLMLALHDQLAYNSVAQALTAAVVAVARASTPPLPQAQRQQPLAAPRRQAPGRGLLPRMQRRRGPEPHL